VEGGTLVSYGTTGFAASEGNHAAIEAIALACEVGIENGDVAGPWNPRVLEIVRQYRDGVLEQRSIEASGYDVCTSAKVMAALPKLKTVSCCVGGKTWVQVDWLMTTGVKEARLPMTEYLASGKSNITTKMTKLLCAIGQAGVVCQPRERYIDLETLIIDNHIECRRECYRCGGEQNVALNQIDLSGDEVPMRDALARLKDLIMSQSPRAGRRRRGEKPGNDPDVDVQRQARASRPFVCGLHTQPEDQPAEHYR
jgi:hypothetical protein